jgi:class 3 adenylate cyclase
VGTITLTYERDEGEGSKYCDSVSLNDLKKFNVALLELGDVGEKAKISNVLAAVFDLEGFTTFCSQPDAQPILPRYLNSFLVWLFSTIRSSVVQGKTARKAHLYSPLPFFGKFTGDGVLFLWTTKDFGTKAKMGNAVVNLMNICSKYESEFLKKAAAKFPNPPGRLRVGIAQGDVSSIGGGRDYVGSCMNTAARLQKLASLSFALHKTGFDLETCFSERTRRKLCVAKTALRGIGDDELVIVPRAEVEALPPETRRFFEINS